MTHKFWVHNLTIHRLCVCFLYYQQNSCLSTTRLITRKYLCCQETIELIFTKTSFVGSCAFVFMNKKVCVCLCGWFDVDDGAVSGNNCCPKGLCHLLLDGLAKKNHWQTL